jgi:superfamily II DNA helicase RecQ
MTSAVGLQGVFLELMAGIERNFRVTPREWQRNVFLHLLAGLDVLVSAGTGSGKSLLFRGMCLLFAQASVLVISPLKALMEHQVKVLMAAELIIGRDYERHWDSECGYT